MNTKGMKKCPCVANSKFKVTLMSPFQQLIITFAKRAQQLNCFSSVRLTTKASEFVCIKIIIMFYVENRPRTFHKVILQIKSIHSIFSCFYSIASRQTCHHALTEFQYPDQREISYLNLQFLVFLMNTKI